MRGVQMRFLGNKTRMLENIQYVIDENNINGEVFCDLFAGSGSVGDYLKDKFKIVSNDYLYSLSIINKAKLSNETMPNFSNFIDNFGKNPFDYLIQKRILPILNILSQIIIRPMADDNTLVLKMLLK